MENWESEGGSTNPLTPCESCGIMVKPYKDGLCVFCYLRSIARPVKTKPKT